MMCYLSLPTQQLQCCGSVGPTDWAESNFNGADTRNPPEIGVNDEAGTYKVPPSCCIEMEDCEKARVVSLSVMPSNKIYTEVSLSLSYAFYPV